MQARNHASRRLVQKWNVKRCEVLLLCSCAQWEMMLFPVITVFYKGKKAIRRQVLAVQIGIYNYPFMGDAGML